MIVVDHLESISTKYEFSATVLEPLVQTCRTTLSSKIKATGLWGVVRRPLDGDMQGGEGDVQGGDSAWRRRFWAASGVHSALLCRAAREPCREATRLLGGVLCGG